MTMQQITGFDKDNIVAFRECEKSNRWISEKLSICHTSIGRLLKKYDETEILCGVEGNGRKRKITVRYI